LSGAQGRTGIHEETNPQQQGKWGGPCGRTKRNGHNKRNQPILNARGERAFVQKNYNVGQNAVGPQQEIPAGQKKKNLCSSFSKFILLINSNRPASTRAGFFPAPASRPLNPQARRLAKKFGGSPMVQPAFPPVPPGQKKNRTAYYAARTRFQVAGAGPGFRDGAGNDGAGKFFSDSTSFQPLIQFCDRTNVQQIRRRLRGPDPGTAANVVPRCRPSKRQARSTICDGSTPVLFGHARSSRRFSLLSFDSKSTRAAENQACINSLSALAIHGHANPAYARATREGTRCNS